MVLKYDLLAALFSVCAVFARSVSVPDSKSNPDSDSDSLSGPSLASRAYMIKGTKMTDLTGILWPGDVVWCLDSSDNKEHELILDMAEKSWKMWRDVIGDESVLEFAPVHDKKPECSKYRGKIDMLEIKLNNEKKILSYNGYVKGDNRLDFDLSATYGARTPLVNFAHELGHVFGLLHTHQQRRAWPSLLNLNCQNLGDYDRLKERGVDVDKICEDLDQQAAEANKFWAEHILPDSNVQNDVIEDDKFDWDSIMLYDSYAFAKPGTVALVKADGSHIPVNVKPSKGDGEAIRTLYPGEESSDYDSD
ncbi:Uu.00g051220.m01.CDS01 [Anthostomella pinea]|uniref:Uu.00g051220.m01.CDS01 n=1 Tax=Anthostomella pinea TaxID=933095 RepID=A0AAI8VTF8_9PEZI|nr:Uu.00g051220.m01.CDS01 [Anthostomella pinea]